MPAITRILVPVDFSPCSRAALEYAAFLADKHKASVDVLHVWESPRYVGPEMLVDIPGQTRQSFAQFAHSYAGREMERFLSLLEEGRKLPVRGRLETGEPVQRILDAAGEGYDLVVMGTHGHTGLSHLVLGSVAERVVRRAPCPVLTIRLSDKEALPVKGAEDVPETD